VAHTFDELVAMQRAADAAHDQAERLRQQYGPPAAQRWSDQQLQTYETAWRAWRDLARNMQIALTAYAKGQGETRQDAETRVKTAAGRPE
jgi:hypothetical protein